ncbi:MAG: IPT/TIG domain-containing protein [Thermodesulfobacteriota bacterium]
MKTDIIYQNRKLPVLMAFIAAMVVFLTTGSAEATCYQTQNDADLAGASVVRIHGLVYTAASTTTPAVVDPVTGIVTPSITTPEPAPAGGPITNASVMVQNMHHGGPFECYAAATGNNAYEVFVPVGEEYVVEFSAPGHDVTSREFSLRDTVAGALLDPVDAFIPPMDPVTGELPTAHALLYAFKDMYVNSEDDYPDDPAFPGVTFYVFDEDGNFEQSGVSGTQTMADMPPLAGPDIQGLYYFSNLKPGEHKVMAIPPDVTVPTDPGTGLPVLKCDIGPDSGWFWVATEEGTQCWDMILRPNDVGTMAGAYLAWYAFIPNLGQLPPSAEGTGTITGTFLDADGTDPFEVISPHEVPQICNYDHVGHLCTDLTVGYHPAQGQRASYIQLDVNGDPVMVPNDPVTGQEVLLVPPPTNPVEDCTYPNMFMPDGVAVLWAAPGAPVAGPIATAMGSNVDGTFRFDNVPPGNYKIFASDVPMDYIWQETQITVDPLLPAPAVDIFMPRWYARINGHVIDDTTGTNLNDVKVDLRLKDGSVWKNEMTAPGHINEYDDPIAEGFFNFDNLAEVEVMGHLSVDMTSLPDTYRGVVAQTCYDDIRSPIWPFPIVCENFDESNRDIGWFTANYRTNLHVEQIPAGVGEIIGSVYNEHLVNNPTTGLWGPQGIHTEGEDPLLTGVTVNLYNDPIQYDGLGNPILVTTTTGSFHEWRTQGQGHTPPYTPREFIPSTELCPAASPFPGMVVYNTGDMEVDEWGGIYKGPRLGQYEFRDVAPGNYIVEAVLPNGYFASPAGTEQQHIVVAGGHRNDVDFGASTLVPRAGEVEGGVFDDLIIDTFHQSILWWEKQGVPHVGVGIYDHHGYKLGSAFMGNPRCYEKQPNSPLWKPTPDFTTSACPATEPDPLVPGQSQKPEVERRAAPGVHIWLANDPTLIYAPPLPGTPAASIPVQSYRTDYLPLGLNYVFGQGKFKFEADWSLLPLTPPLPAGPGAGPAAALPALPANAPVIINGAPQARNFGPNGEYGVFKNAVYTASNPLDVQLVGWRKKNAASNPVVDEFLKNNPKAKQYLQKNGLTPRTRQCIKAIRQQEQGANQILAVAGNPYVINGVNFGDAQGHSTVSLSGQELKVISWSDTSITVDIPQSSIPGPMIVATTEGLSNSTQIDLATINATPDWTAYLAAHTMYVDAAAQVGAGDGSSASPYATITEAMDNLITVRPVFVMVAPGSYNENVHIIESDIKIIGAGPFESMIDGLVVNNMDPLALSTTGSFSGSSGAVFYIGKGGMLGSVSNIAISGFTITGGYPGSLGTGGGIFADYGNTNIDINNNIMSHNSAEYGGAIWMHHSNHDVRIWSNLISENGNYGGYSGGISINDEPEYGPAEPVLDHSYDDQLNSTPPGTYEIFNNLLYRNYSPDYGGAMALYEIKDHLKIYGNMIMENRSDDHGGGLFFEDSGPVDLYDNVILRNFAADDGGGISFEDVGDDISVVNVYNNVIAENIADDRGENTARGGGIAFDDTLRAKVYNNTITGNIVAGTFDPTGGAIDSERHGHEYDADSTAPKWPYFSDVQVFNNIIWDNWRLHYDARHEDPDYTVGQNYQWTLDNIHVDNPAVNLPWETDQNSDTYLVKEFNIINGVVNKPNQTGRQHNIDADPMFVNPAVLDWHVQATSPAIGTGRFLKAPGYDADLIFRQPDCLTDIGALEYRDIPAPAEVITIPDDLLGYTVMPIPGSTELNPPTPPVAPASATAPAPKMIRR